MNATDGATTTNTAAAAKPRWSMESVEDALRRGQQSKEIAKQVGVPPTALYSKLSRRGAFVATMRFLVGPTGRPLRRVTAADIKEAGKRAVNIESGG